MTKTDGVFSATAINTAEFLKKYSCKGLFALYVAEEYRGQGFARKMIEHTTKALMSKVDYVFIPVLEDLKTHTLWKKFGALEFYKDHEGRYYILSENEKINSRFI